MDRISIITVGHLPPPTTGENICRSRLEEALLRMGHRVSVFARGSARLWLRSAQAVVIVNGQSWPGTLYDIVFCTWQVLLGRNVYLYFHNRSWTRYRGWAYLWRLRFDVDVKALVLTPAIRDWLAGRGFEAIVLNNTGGAEFEKLPHPVQKKRLVWVGRPESVKGFEIALAAFELIRREDPAWVFDVYGSDGGGFSEMPGVVFHGFVSGAPKVAAFQGGGVFILPSAYVNETQPLSIIEALAAGLPVVASDVGGIAGMIRSPVGDAGLVVRERDAETYASAVRSSYEGYTLFSTNAQRIYRESFSHDAFTRDVEAIFGKVDSPELESARQI